MLAWVDVSGFFEGGVAGFVPRRFAVRRFALVPS